MATAAASSFSAFQDNGSSSTRSKTSRSQFIDKLHALLEDPFDPESLRWISDDAFEISANDLKARRALSPQWEFRSLSSFIRQLSYYNFKRLSDRRRSSERRASSTGYIVFTHPSGLFIRGDSSRLEGIHRKLRARPEKSITGGRNGRRRVSTTSSGSAEGEERSPAMQNHIALPPVPDIHPRWNVSSEHTSALSSAAGLNGSGSPAGSRGTRLPEYRLNTYSSSSLAPPSSTQGYSYSSSNQPYMSHNAPRHQDISSWRPYSPPVTKWSNSSPIFPPPTSSNTSAAAAARRASISDFKSTTSRHPQAAATAGAPTEYIDVASHERPRLRKSGSTLGIQSVAQQQAHQPNGSSYTTAYPTPAYPPAQASFTNPWSSTWTSNPNQNQRPAPNLSSRLPHAFAHSWASTQGNGETRRYYDNASTPHQQLLTRVDSIDYGALSAGAGDIHDGLPSPSGSHSNPVTPADELPNPIGYDPRKLFRPPSNVLGLESIPPHEVSSPYDHQGITQVGHTPYGVHDAHDVVEGPHTSHGGIYFAENRAPSWHQSSTNPNRCFVNGPEHTGHN